MEEMWEAKEALSKRLQKMQTKSVFGPWHLTNCLPLIKGDHVGQIQRSAEIQQFARGEDTKPCKSRSNLQLQVGEVATTASVQRFRELSKRSSVIDFDRLAG